MALTPTNDEALLREVDDAVRQDRLVSFWRRFGIWIVGAIVLGLIAFAGWLWWNSHSRGQAGETAERLQKVMQQAAADNGKVDMAELDALTRSDAEGYRASALLTKAAVAAKAGKRKEAVDQYRRIAADETLAPPWRDLALVRQTALEFESLKPDDVIARLKPLAQPGNPWFGSAGEMTAIAHMKKRDFKVAGSLFAAIAKDEGVPRTLRSRAVQMAGLLGVDATDAKP